MKLNRLKCVRPLSGWKKALCVGAGVVAGTVAIPVVACGTVGFAIEGVSHLGSTRINRVLNWQPSKSAKINMFVGANVAGAACGFMAYKFCQGERHAIKLLFSQTEKLTCCMAMRSGAGRICGASVILSAAVGTVILIGGSWMFSLTPA